MAHTSQRPKRPELIPIFLAWSMLRNIATPPLDGMQVHRKVTPSSTSPVPIHTPGWRETKWSGLTLSSNLSWRAHIFKIYQKASKKLNLLKPLKYNLSRYTLEVLFKSLVRSSLEYANVVWDGCSESDNNLLESLQIEGARVVTGALKGTNRVSLSVKWTFLGRT